MGKKIKEIIREFMRWDVADRIVIYGGAVIIGVMIWRCLRG